MSNEKANEFLSWRGRLTPPDAFPGQGLEDKELTWQRLAERLEKKPARRAIVWWIAAACLLMALLPATLFFRTRPARPTRLATHTPALTPAHIPIIAPAKAPARTPTPPPTATRIAAHPPTHTPTPITPHPTPKQPILTHIRPTLNPNYGEFATITSIPSPPTSTPLLASSANPATPPPHRALRIVYLNEIDNNPGPPAITTGPRQPGFLRLGTGTAAATSTATNTADWTTTQQSLSIINIKVSSPNH